MTAIDNIQRYTRTARFFHWFIALLMVGMYATDWTRGALERGSAASAFLLATHMSFGLLVFALTVLRLFWRLAKGAPAPVPASPLMQFGAKAGHLVLYLFTLGLPVSGALRAMAGGKQIFFFGLSVPAMIAPDQTLQAAVRPLHGGLLMNLLLALIIAHVLAALWHQLVLKDGTLNRMA